MRTPIPTRSYAQLAIAKYTSSVFREMLPSYYAGISNSDDLALLDCVLSGRILDQSPTDETPRNLIIDIAGVSSLLDSTCQKPMRPREQPLKKLRPHYDGRDVVAVWLPSELMAYIRSSYPPGENG